MILSFVSGCIKKKNFVYIYVYIHIHMFMYAVLCANFNHEIYVRLNELSS